MGFYSRVKTINPVKNEILNVLILEVASSVVLCLSLYGCDSHRQKHLDLLKAIEVKQLSTQRFYQDLSYQKDSFAAAGDTSSAKVTIRSMEKAKASIAQDSFEIDSIKSLLN